MSFPTITTICGHTLLPACIRKGGVVVDLGANRGEFARQVLSRFDVTCYSVEPTPHLVKAIAPSERLKVFGYAVTGTDAPVTFHLSENPEMSSLDPSVAHRGSASQSVTVPGRTLKSILDENRLDSVDLLKVDIEGAERGMFASVDDATLQKIAQITIEFHDFVNAYEPAVVLEMARRIESAGFRSIKFSRSNMNWLFYQPDRCGVGAIGHAYLNHAVRWARWVGVALGKRGE